MDKGRVVKGKKFKNIEDVADPSISEKVYEDGADELVFYDIKASQQKTSRILRRLIAEIAKEVSIPYTVGGGIRTLEDIQRDPRCWGR